MPGLSIVVLALALVAPAAAQHSDFQATPPSDLLPFGQFVDEAEPNDTIANNQPLGTPPIRVRGTLYRTPYVAPNADVDIYSFIAPPGARLFAATMTSFSPGAQDTVVDVLDTDGTTLLDSDNDDGFFGSQASAIGGVLLSTGGTYYIRVRQGQIATLGDTVRPYDLYVNVVLGTPTAEVEPNGGTATATPIDASGWASGIIGTPGDQDWFSFDVAAGDTIVAILDADPERDTPDWNPQIGIGVFNGVMINVDSSGDASPAEAWMITAKNAGTYYLRVEDDAGTGDAAHTYRLAVFVIKPKTRTGCQTYAGTGGPIGDLATTDFPVNVPDQQLVDYVKLNLTATHPDTTDLDVTLTAPGGDEIVLFDDLANVGGVPAFDLVLEDEGALPVSAINLYKEVHAAPEAGARFEHFKGMPSQGTWRLRFRDDTASATAGSVISWSLTVCGVPRPACVLPGPVEAVTYSSDFETGDGGFLHSGTLDEWERGTPSAPPLQTAHSGTQAWSIDLDNTYENLSNQNLVSPPISLAGLTGRITLDWWQEFNMDNAGFDSYWVEVRPVGSSTGKRVFTWTGGSMTRTMGSPPVLVLESAGWARMRADISNYAGQNVEAVFHLDSDGLVALAGVSVDDVAVTSCPFVFGQPFSNLAITKTDNQFTYYPGEVKTYTIVASNAGPQPAIGATVTDTFPPQLTAATWTCVASAGSSCGAPSGTGNINRTVNLLLNGTATFTVTTTVAAGATGTLANTAAIAVPAGWNDSDPVNNSATDNDVLRASAPDGLAVDTAGNGVYQPNEPVEMAPSWRNLGSSAAVLAGVLSNHTGPPGPSYQIFDGVADYGSVPAGGVSSCTTTGNCFSVKVVAAARPATHWDSTVVETIQPTSSLPKTWTLHVGDSFTDVPATNGFYKFIETLLHRAVTGGCTGTTYCPTSPTTRDQMAVFALVSKEGAAYLPPACVAGTEIFADVPAANGFCRWIEELVRRGVVSGCGGGNYCPTNPVTREQMSIFMLLTLDPAMNPPACAPPNLYLDVPETSGFCRWIEELTNRAVVSGCGGGNYCPTAPVTREQMGVFLGVTFGLTLYGVN